LSAAWDCISKDHGYQLKNLLGEGSFGTVMAAKHIATGEMVAIKLIEEPFLYPYQAL